MIAAKLRGAGGASRLAKPSPIAVLTPHAREPSLQNTGSEARAVQQQAQRVPARSMQGAPRGGEGYPSCVNAQYDNHATLLSSAETRGQRQGWGKAPGLWRRPHLVWKVLGQVIEVGQPGCSVQQELKEGGGVLSSRSQPGTPT